MTQDPLNPIAPQGETSSPASPQTPLPPTPPSPPPVPQKPAASSGVDLSKILLPKKEVHAPENAERINAGALLQSEQGATLVPQKPIEPAPAATPSPQKDESVVRAINTYQSDIERLVQNKNTSVVSIAAAEASRRAEQPLMTQERGGSDTSSSWIARSLYIIGGVVMLIAAVGAILYMLRPAPSVTIAPETINSIIAVDKIVTLSVPRSSLQHSTAMAALDQEREKVSLSLGLIERFYLTFPATTTGGSPVPFTAQDTIALIGPNAPSTLARALKPTDYVLGVHAFENNQAFLLLGVTSYEQAFSSMLGWERFMQQDLLPFFLRTPSIKIIDTTSPVASTSASTTPPSQQVVSTAFKDKIVENHDTRVIQNAEGDIVLLWTFLDRNTLLITTNEVTLREILSRLTSTPIVPLP